MGEIWIYSLSGFAFIAIIFYIVKKSLATEKVKYGDYQARIKHFTVKIALNPNDASAYYERGIAQLKTQNRKAALEDLKIAASHGDTRAYQVIEQNNLETDYLINSRNVNVNSIINSNKYDDYKGSIADYDKVLKANPQNSTAYFMRAEIKELYNDLSGALDDLNNALKYNNKYTVAYYKRGEIKLKLEDFEGARLDLKTSLSLGYNKSSKLLEKINSQLV